MSDASAERNSSTPRYDFDEIDLESNSVHADVVRLVGEAKRVLELGPATGYMSKAMVDRACSVVGIELDPAMGEKAERFCERVIVGNLDELDLDAELGEEKFDVIVAADVLEHLRDPLATLTALRGYLADDGAFVISIPNVAHGSVRLALLAGHFRYGDIGLLDSTHLRFFTRESFEQLLDEAELGLVELRRHDLNLDASEIEVDFDAVPDELRKALERDPDARTYQFVAKAVPMAREGLREIQGRLRELAELRFSAELEQRTAEHTAERVVELERALAEIAGREGELRRALINAHDQLLRRDAELDELRRNSARREEEIARINNELVAARVGLERIRASAPFRLYRKLNELPGVRLLRRRREAEFAAEMAKRNRPNT
jgi:2-polyprenyl-3-methyl-5-hydroxy-6-metoxy-1,4-benzoquinol methylase